MHDWIETCNFNMFGAVVVFWWQFPFYLRPIQSQAMWYLFISLWHFWGHAAAAFMSHHHVGIEAEFIPPFCTALFEIFAANLCLESSESIYFLQYCSVGGDDEILSNEVKSLGVKFLYLISNTHQVFLVLGKHTSLTAALLIERFLLIIQQGGIYLFTIFTIWFFV